MENFRTKEINEIAGTDFSFVQGNISHSVPWTLRGLHYQIVEPQGKLIYVVAGGIQDVAVDLRKGSSTYGKHVSVFLNHLNCLGLWVPPGFAHGFLALAQGASVVYQCSTYYEEAWSASLKWDDPDLNIHWFLPNGQIPIISNKDRRAPTFAEIDPMEL